MGDARTASGLVLLVSAGVFINYIDRGDLATAAPLMGMVTMPVAPAITGVLVDRTGLFDVAFTLAAAVNVQPAP